MFLIFLNTFSHLGKRVSFSGSQRTFKFGLDRSQWVLSQAGQNCFKTPQICGILLSAYETFKLDANYLLLISKPSCFNYGRQLFKDLFSTPFKRSTLNNNDDERNVKVQSWSKAWWGSWVSNVFVAMTTYDDATRRDVRRYNSWELLVTRRSMTVWGKGIKPPPSFETIFFTEVALPPNLDLWWRDKNSKLAL